MTRLTAVIALPVLLCMAPGCAEHEDPPRSTPVSTRAIVLGSFPDAVRQAGTDLSKAGMAVIDPARVRDAVRQQHGQLAQSSAEKVDLLKVGRSLGADIIVFLEVVSGRGPGSCAGPPCEVIYSPFVSARAFSAETGRLVWSGRAYSSTTEPRLTGEIMALTHEAISHGMTARTP